MNVLQVVACCVDVGAWLRYNGGARERAHYAVRTKSGAGLRNICGLGREPPLPVSGGYLGVLRVCMDVYRGVNKGLMG